MPRPSPPQAGFALVGLAIALLIATILSVLAGHALSQRLDDLAATATGRALATVRGALVTWQIRHEAWLAGEDLSAAPTGTYPPPPPLVWTPLGGGIESLRFGLDTLIQDGLLSGHHPRHTPLGERAAIVVVRHGPCPGTACRIAAYVHTCHPISRVRSSRADLPCGTPAAARAQYHPALLGQVLLAADGYGGHDAGVDHDFRGPLLHAARSWFEISGAPGHAVVSASLDTTPFGQFVRHGDHRPVVLRNRLAVQGELRTDTGLLLPTTATPGGACAGAWLYGRAATGHLAVCRNQQWHMLHGREVQAIHVNLRHGDTVAAPTCPPPAQAFRHVALQATDATVTGSALNIHGGIGGAISGTGQVNAAGQVNLSGSFSGTFLADASSSVRTGQSASLGPDGRIQITPDGAQARATIIQGCTTS